MLIVSRADVERATARLVLDRALADGAGVRVAV